MNKTPHIHSFEKRSYLPIALGDSARFILFRKCSCGLRKAYDLVPEKPTG